MVTISPVLPRCPGEIPVPLFPCHQNGRTDLAKAWGRSWPWQRGSIGAFSHCVCPSAPLLSPCLLCALLAGLQVCLYRPVFLPLSAHFLFWTLVSLPAPLPLPLQALSRVLFSAPWPSSLRCDPAPPWCSVLLVSIMMLTGNGKGCQRPLFLSGEKHRDLLGLGVGASPAPKFWAAGREPVGSSWVPYTSRWVLLPWRRQADADSSVLVRRGTRGCRHGLEGRRGMGVCLLSV